MTNQRLAQDGLGSINAAVDGSGTATSSELFTPYGGGFCSSGVMPTVRRFTGQYIDKSTFGLDYYGARYYVRPRREGSSPAPTARATG